MAWLKRLSPLVFFGIGAACGDSSGPPDGGASAPPHHLAFITQPPTLAMQSAALTPGIIVEVRDSTNAIVRGTLVVVTLALAANPGSATLLGTTAKSSSTGRVTFSDLAVNQRGRGFRLSASSDSLVAALSDSFNVVAPLPVRQIAAGDQHTCAVHTAGTTYCWGRNAGGEVGDSSTTQREFPVLVRTDLRFDTISAGIGASCGITSAGAGYCWGSDLDGKLGDSGFIGSSSPVSIKGGLTFAGPISAAFEHSCGLTTSGAAYCWGGNIFGQLGNGDSARQGSLAVVPVAGGLLFDQVRARNFHTCAIALGGAAYCWGNNSFGQLGDGTDTTRLAPQAVPGDHVFLSITTGAAHSCGIATDAKTYCWGDNRAGQIGDGTTDERSRPRQVLGGHAFVAVDAQGSFTCGLTALGAAWCWGANYGTLPVAITQIEPFVALSVGYEHACGVTATSKAYCWGMNAYGRLGDGTTTYRSVPTLVVY